MRVVYARLAINRRTQRRLNHADTPLRTGDMEPRPSRPETLGSGQASPQADGRTSRGVWSLSRLGSVSLAVAEAGRRLLDSLTELTPAASQSSHTTIGGCLSP